MDNRSAAADNVKPDPVSRYRNQVIRGDALEVLPQLPDRSIDAVITDPVWPDTCLNLPGGDRVYDLWTQTVKEIARLTDRLVVILGCDTDIRFLATVPETLPFFRVCWLRRVPCSYRGPLLYGADIAYVFVARWLNGTDRVIGGESTAVVQTDKDPDNPHPCKRHLHHMSWLVRVFTRPGQLVLDPFCGSGSTLVAAKLAGRDYCGIDIVPEYVSYSQKRLNEPDLFHPVTLVESVAP